MQINNDVSLVCFNHLAIMKINKIIIKPKPIGINISIHYPPTLFSVMPSKVMPKNA